MASRYFKKLVELCNSKGFTMAAKVRTANKRLILYKIIINKESRGKTLCFTSGIHGNELCGPRALIEFMEKYNPKKSDPRIIILPVLNPYGFLKRRYKNYDNINLNRHFFERPLPRDNKIILSLIKNEKIDIFLSVHEDDELKGYYIYNFGRRNKLFNRLIKFLSKTSRVCKNNKIHNDYAENGVVNGPEPVGCLDEWVSKKGVPISACLEVPDSIPLHKRVETVCKLFEYIVNIYSQ